jgi:hypothetical protein
MDVVIGAWEDKVTNRWCEIEVRNDGMARAWFKEKALHEAVEWETPESVVCTILVKMVMEA